MIVNVLKYIIKLRYEKVCMSLYLFMFNVGFKKEDNNCLVYKYIFCFWN